MPAQHVDIEKIRAELARAVKERPPLAPTTRALLEALLPEINEMLRVGYTVKDITEKLNHNGVSIKMTTVQQHLRQLRAGDKKPKRKRVTKPEPAALPSLGPTRLPEFPSTVAQDLVLEPPQGAHRQT
ncbi:MAG: response regulator transcription factor [Proteobacteria bacterium]|nr:response regulator transcription factor [Pseudomonadota bacterium]